jgi:hypothetical protein
LRNFKQLFAACKVAPVSVAFSDVDKSLLIRVFVNKIQVGAEKYIGQSRDHDKLGLTQEDTGSRDWRLDIHNIQVFQEWIGMTYSLIKTMDSESPQSTLACTLTYELGGAVLQQHTRFDQWLNILSPKTPLEASATLDHTLSDLYLDAAHPSYEITQTRAKAEANLSEYLEIVDGLRNDWFVDTIHRLLALICRRTQLLIPSRRLLGKGLKDIQGDLVALIAGVDIPMILRKEGSSYRSKSPAYIHGMMYGEIWPKDENVLIDIILS